MSDKVTREERLLEVLKILPYLRSKHPLYHEEFDAIRALIREHRLEVNEVSIELEVLKTERAGYEAENQIRLSSGEALAYGADAFQELAERMKGLNARVMVKEG